MDDCAAVAAAAGVNISDDLVVDILSRLPPISLLVCKCVSKSWHRLVSALIHSRARPWPMTGLFVGFSNYINGYAAIKFFNLTGDNDGLDDSLDYLPCHPNTRLVDCRDGLLLCSSNEYYERDKYFVCNPITRQWVSLPYPPERYSSSGYPWPAPIAALVLDDDDDDHDHEESDFCYSHFKVIQFVNLKDHLLEDEVEASCYLYVDVFSSKTGKWEGSKPKDFTTFSLSDRVPPVYSDGVLFLPGLPCGDPPFHLLLYHVKEEYSEDLLLPADFGLFDSKCLGKSQGLLHYAYRHASKMEVWMMIERGGHSHRTSDCEWILKHSLDLADIGFPVPEERGEQLDIAAFHPNSDEIFINRNGDFFCYNFKTKAMDKVAYFNHSGMWPCFHLNLYPFSPCLRRLVHGQQRSTQKVVNMNSSVGMQLGAGEPN